MEKMIRTSVYLPAALLNELNATAAREGRTQSNQIRRALELHVRSRRRARYANSEGEPAPTKRWWQRAQQQ